MPLRIIHQILTLLTSGIWLVNGLFCKVLNWVPRHEQIVARFFGESYSRFLIIVIGVFEILMAIWIVSGFKPKINALFQIAIIAIMNLMEFIWAKDLLLWGSGNLIFAILLIVTIYFNSFILSKPTYQSL